MDGPAGQEGVERVGAAGERTGGGGVVSVAELGPGPVLGLAPEAEARGWWRDAGKGGTRIGGAAAVAVAVAVCWRRWRWQKGPWKGESAAKKKGVRWNGVNDKQQQE